MSETWKKCAAFCLAAALAFSCCAEERKSELRECEPGKLDIGLAMLEDGQFNEAAAELESFLEECDPESPEALFGAGVSKALSTFDLLFMILSVVSQYQATSHALSENGAAEEVTQNEYLAATISEVFGEISDRLLSAAAYFDELKGFEDFSITVRQIPVFIKTKQTMRFRGEFDSADVRMLHSLSLLGSVAVDTLAAQDFRTDIMGALYRNRNLADIGGSSLRGILDAVVYLLRSGPGFLELDGEDGEARFSTAKDRLLAAVEDLIEARALIEREEDGQEDDVLVFEAESGSLVLKADLCNSGAGDRFNPVRTELLTLRTIDAARDLEDSLKQGKGRRVGWASCVSPLLASIGTLFLSMKILDAFGVDLPISEYMASASRMERVLEALVPDVFEFDFPALYSKPAGLRGLLPAWKEDVRGGGSIMLEWECGQNLDQDGFPSGKAGLVCRPEDQLSDSAHFIGTKYEIEADMTAATSPYIAFQDPTFNGLLFTDPSVLEVPDYGDEPGFEPAGQRDLNVILAKVLPPILIFLGN